MSEARISTKQFQKILNDRKGYNYQKTVRMNQEQASPLRNIDNNQDDDHYLELKLKEQIINDMNNLYKEAALKHGNNREIIINKLFKYIILINEDIGNQCKSLDKWYTPNELWTMQQEGHLTPSRVIKHKLEYIIKTFNGYVRIKDDHIELMRLKQINHIKNAIINKLIYIYLDKKTRDIITTKE